jgi:hypothetical protein
MHFNLDNDYRLSPNLDTFGEFSYTDVSDCSTYKHPPIHYKLKENPESVRVVNQIEAGPVRITHYEQIEQMMKEAEGYTEIELTDPETGEKYVEKVGSGSESLFPKWMMQTSLSWVNVQSIDDNGEPYYHQHLEINDKYMALHQHESSYHSLSSSEDFQSYEKEMKGVMTAIDNENWDEVKAFQHYDSHRYEMKAMKDMPLFDLERPIQGEY